MSTENKNARPCDAHLQITKLFLRLSEAECRDVLTDLRHRHPDVWASVAGTESEVAK